MRLTPKDRLFIGVALAVIAIDQLTKYFISLLPSGSGIPLLGKFLMLTHTQNTGAAFGMLQGRNMALIAVTLAILAAMAWYYKNISKGHIIYAAMICGGAIGNLIDRVRLGYVTDFIGFSFWPTFNVADIAVTIGALMLAYFIFKEK